MYIDTHSHLFAPEFDADMGIVMARASEAGVSKIIMPAVSPESYDDMERLAARYPGVLYPTIGLHPTEQGDTGEAEKRLEADAGRYIAIGECGLDMHWTPETIDRQTEILSRHFELSRTYGLPLIIHTREAFGRMIELLRRLCRRLSRHKGDRRFPVRHRRHRHVQEFTATRSGGGNVARRYRPRDRQPLSVARSIQGPAQRKRQHTSDSRENSRDKRMLRRHRRSGYYRQC